MKNEQKYLKELQELFLFLKLYHNFYNKMKFSLSGIQEKAFDTVYYDTIKQYNKILVDRNLSFNNPAIEFISIETPSLDINLNKELSELKKLIDAPIQQISQDWFYLFVIISIRLKNGLSKKNKYQLNEKLLIQKFCEKYFDENHKARVKGGKNGAINCSHQKVEAEEIYKKFAAQHPDLIDVYKNNPSKNKPKTTLKRMLEKGKETSSLKDRTLQKWTRELLKNNGVLNKKCANN